MTAADQFGQLDYVQWSADVLGGLGATVGQHNLTALVAWCLAEGGHNNNSAAWNPLGTTITAATAGLPPEAVVRSINSHGVKAYRSRADGLAATLATLRLPRYTAVVSALVTDAQPAAVSAAVAASGWGTGAGLAANIGRASRMVAGAHVTPAPAGGAAAGTGQGIKIPNPLDLLPGGGAVSAAGDAITGLTDFAGLLTSWDTWRRVLLVIGGAGLVALGLVLATGDVSGVSSQLSSLVEASA